MIDLKPYKDALEKAQEEAMNVALQIDELVQDGESIEDALALQSELDEAEAKVQAAQKMYDSMTKVSDRGDVAAKFVPVTDKQDPQLGEQKRDPKLMTRAEFDALSAKERMAFVKDGGKVVDQIES